MQVTSAPTAAGPHSATPLITWGRFWAGCSGPSAPPTTACMAMHARPSRCSIRCPSTSAAPAWARSARYLMVTHLTMRAAVSRRLGAWLRYCVHGSISSARSPRPSVRMNTERERLRGNVLGPDGWKHWGPYLSERQWGTVREDYSPGGNAWEHFPHDHARSRAYRWGEDGIAGLSDAEPLACLSLAMWNGADPILKERLFGLCNAEGNHGEDVKEHYFYLDATPTHSYLKMLYKYP